HPAGAWRRLAPQGGDALRLQHAGKSGLEEILGHRRAQRRIALRVLDGEAPQLEALGPPAERDAEPRARVDAELRVEVESRVRAPGDAPRAETHRRFQRELLRRPRSLERPAQQ